MQILPEGVHVLSAESQAALARAKQRGDAIAARHAKLARLAAASIATGLVARLAEQQTFNLLGAGSNPAEPTKGH